MVLEPRYDYMSVQVKSDTRDKLNSVAARGKRAATTKLDLLAAMGGEQKFQAPSRQARGRAALRAKLHSPGAVVPLASAAKFLMQNLVPHFVHTEGAGVAAGGCG